MKIAILPGDGIGTEIVQQRRQHGRALGITRGEIVERLAVREVQPADAGKQKFAPRRRHRIEDLDRVPGFGQHLGGHQPGRAGSDDMDGRAHEAATRRATTTARSSA